MKSDIPVLGTWQFGGSRGYWEDQDINKSRETVRTAVKRGIKVFDTAYSYPNAETLIAPMLPDDAIIFTKVMPVPSLERKVETSLKRLKRESVDTLFLHWPTGDEKQLSSSIDTLFKLKTKGLIQRVGYSNFPLSMIRTLPRPDRIERAISLLWLEELEETKAYCLEKDITLVGYSPLAMGLLSGKYRKREDLADKRREHYAFDNRELFHTLLDALQEVAEAKRVSPASIALAWARRNADATVFGARNKIELEENLKVPGLSADEEEYLTKMGNALKGLAPFDNQLNHEWR
jgi:Predicted oxidoreductases (related to aryl-alcohol dehydrogenases)